MIFIGILAFLLGALVALLVADWIHERGCWNDDTGEFNADEIEIFLHHNGDSK